MLHTQVIICVDVIWEMIMQYPATRNFFLASSWNFLVLLTVW